MHLVTKTDDYDLWMIRLESPFSFQAPFDKQDFALLLVVVDPTITIEDRTTICKEIIQQGCRYAVCTGMDCSSWHDFIDMAYLESDPEFSPPDERFVMTTWHEDESLEEVVEYFRSNAHFESFTPRHYLVLLLGGDTGVQEKVASILKKQFEPSL